VVWQVIMATTDGYSEEKESQWNKFVSDLISDILGNLVRPQPAVDPAWFLPDVTTTPSILS